MIRDVFGRASDYPEETGRAKEALRSGLRTMIQSSDIGNVVSQPGCEVAAKVEHDYMRAAMAPNPRGIEGIVIETKKKSIH